MKKKVVGLGICMLMFVAAVLPVAATETGCASCGDQTVKWEQLPDITENGTDVCVTSTMEIPRMLADDFKCTMTGPITDVHLWGSWFQDQKGIIKAIHLSIHEDIPANESPTQYSIPGKVLWQMNFSAGQFTEKLYHEGTAEWWWDPYTGELVPKADHAIWQYDINISATNAFIQQGTPNHPVIYWLDVYVETSTGIFGWKTAGVQWNDDAVYRVGTPTPMWLELKYPTGHPLQGRSVDLAFRITTTPVCCYKVEIPRQIRLFKVKVLVTETCNQSHTNVPWNITITRGAGIPLYFTGSIATIAAGGTATITSGSLVGFGVITITVKVNDCPPVVKRGFLFLWIVIVF